MKKFVNQIDDNQFVTQSEAVTLIHIPINTILRKSTLQMMSDSCLDYSSRVWNVVKADMEDHMDELNSNGV